MKKSISMVVAAGVSGLLLSSGVHATALGGNVTTTQCAPLASGVTINVSSNVFGSYVCRDALVQAGSSLPARVGVGACHKGGVTKAQLQTCTRANPSGSDPAVWVYTPSTCADGNFADATTTTAKTGDEGKVLLKGQGYYTASTFGGQLAKEDMGTTACDAAGMESLVGAKYPGTSSSQ